MTICTRAAIDASPHPTTKSHCRIFHLGLDARESLVIESLCRSHPEIAARYVYGPSYGQDCVDLLFVNADDAGVMANWYVLSQKQPGMVTIMVAEDTSAFPGMRVLRKPLNLRNVATILEVITGSCAGNGPSRSRSADTDAVRVLVVDDSFPARQYMNLKIEALAAEAAMPVHIDMADSGERAIDLAHAHAYDLAFLDVVMPGMDGYEACRQLKAIAPMRVVMLTGRVSATDFSRGRSAGSDNYLSKPAHDTDLRSILQLTALRRMTGGPRSGP